MTERFKRLCFETACKTISVRYRVAVNIRHPSGPHRPTAERAVKTAKRKGDGLANSLGTDENNAFAERKAKEPPRMKFPSAVHPLPVEDFPKLGARPDYARKEWL